MSKRSAINIFILLNFLFTFSVRLFAQQENVSANPTKIQAHQKNDWIYDVLHIVKQKEKRHQLVKVAVVDDGFLLSHNSLKNFIYTNHKELQNNYQDDDNNGYQDDVCGWDVSDNDNDVSILKGNEEAFYHGTYIASLIVDVFKQFYGESADQFIKIIPVKVLSDRSKNSHLADGYKGIKYAIAAGADIICCAWSGGEASEDEKNAILKAQQRGVIFIGAAGNFSNENVLKPSAINGVLSVAAIDSQLHKIKESNYGMRVDFSAPGKDIYAAFPVANNAYTEQSGTSPATAIITGCVAILKSINPAYTSRDVIDALQNTASPVDSCNVTYAGKMGFGIPNIEKAISFLSATTSKYQYRYFNKAKGTIFFKKEVSPLSWKITPYGSYKGIHFNTRSQLLRGNVTIYTNDSVCYKGPISALTKGLYVQGNNFTIELRKNSYLSKDITIDYYMETIDSTILYCKETTFINVQEDGFLTDNSGDENYANNTSCKWQLTAPPGKKIEIDFLDIDTEPNVDYIYFFDGESTIQENILAKFSGNNKPPIISSFSNHLLIWFVSNDRNTQKGWSLKYRIIN